MTVTPDQLIPDEPQPSLGPHAHTLEQSASPGAPASVSLLYSGDEDPTCPICHPPVPPPREDDEDLDGDLYVSESSPAFTNAERSVRDGLHWVDEELIRLRSDRASINDRIRDLVAEQDRLKRLVRILNGK